MTRGANRPTSRTQRRKAARKVHAECAKCGYRWTRPEWAVGYLNARCPRCRSRNVSESVDKVSIAVTGNRPRKREGFCRVCGCSQLDACPAGCGWAEPNLCTVCAKVVKAVLIWMADVRRVSWPALRREVNRVEEAA